jgi:hypothetical protein
VERGFARHLASSFESGALAMVLHVKSPPSE